MFVLVKKHRLLAAGLVALATLSSGCDLGRRISGAPVTGPSASPTPSAAARVATPYKTVDGFPLAASFLSPGLAAAYKDDKGYRIAPPGRHYVTIEVTFSNPADDRPAPFLVGQPPRVPRLFLAVPLTEAKMLGLPCAGVPGFAEAFPAASWCPLQVKTALSRPGTSPLNIDVLPPSAMVSDYYFTAATYPDAVLSKLRLSAWDLAVERGPSTYVAVRTSTAEVTTSPTAAATASPTASP